MSFFNIDLLCSECERAERVHQDYNLARSSLRYAFSCGDYDYQGIEGTNHLGGHH